MARLLTADEIITVLPTLSGWTGSPESITRTVQAANFPAAIALVNAVAEAAEKADHHPDIDIRWRNVTFTLATHSAGGVTDKDVDLARQIDALAA